jgi:hypothetical protein
MGDHYIIRFEKGTMASTIPSLTQIFAKHGGSIVDEIKRFDMALAEISAAGVEEIKKVDHVLSVTPEQSYSVGLPRPSVN